MATNRGQLLAKRRELLLRFHREFGKRPVLGLTPTMGALHAGHVSLVERMSGECALGIVTIFVNPRQFGPGEDFARYPRTLDADVELCGRAGAQLVYAPPLEEVYPAGYSTTVHVTGVSEGWCGAVRPGHFDGVATVVAKLFAMCWPDKAYFGEKDYQQLAVIKRMVRDLEMPVAIVPCPTVREADGLAMSSRNAYLTAEERSAAPRLYQALERIAAQFASGETDAACLAKAGMAVLCPLPEKGSEEPRFSVEYLAVVDPLTLESREQAQRGDRVLAGARLGNARLIDNIALPGGQPTC